MKASLINNKNLEKYFLPFRKNTIGINQTFESPYGKQTIKYFDWTASGRLYAPIEKAMVEVFGPYVGNTHTETTETGTDMTMSYHKAYEIIKKHVHAGRDDVLIPIGTGMTGAINKLQRILGFKYSDQLRRFASFDKKNRNKPISKTERPVVFVTHMEHHSNQTSWVEADVELVVVPANKSGLVDPENLIKLLKKYKNRTIKIGSFTAGSNVTGIITPIHKLAKIMHEYDGYCFGDFAAVAPYINIIMRPKDPIEKLDAIFFSPHKFLGGPGTSGILIFDRKLYPKNTPPDHPGGGTVTWTNPWGEQRYHEDIEAREDGGTPGFLQTIRAALCVQVKEQMGVKNILKREEELLEILLKGLRQIPHLHVLDDNGHKRTGIVSFYSDVIHYNLIVKLLNDRFGIQTRGGCSCAGTYGHCLFALDRKKSKAMTDKIDSGDQSTKTGWARISLHPTMKDEEVRQLIQSLQEITKNIKEWKKDYVYSKKTNEFKHKDENETLKKEKIAGWFKTSLKI